MEQIKPDHMFWAVVIVFAFVATVFFTNKWTDNHHEFKLHCLEIGGEVGYGPTCRMPDEATK